MCECQKRPFDGALDQRSNIVREIPGIEYRLPFERRMVSTLLGRLCVRSDIHVDNTGFSNNISKIRMT